jgi:hypothetical protein
MNETFEKVYILSEADGNWERVDEYLKSQK